MGRKTLNGLDAQTNKKNYLKSYYEKNKEKLQEYRKEYYEKNKEKYLKRNKLKRVTPLMLNSGHSFLSPSSLERALLCPASPILCEGLPEESSVYAKEGTAFHELMDYNNRFYTGSIEKDYIESASKLLSKYGFSDSVINELGGYWMQTSEFIQNMKTTITNAGFTITEYKELKIPMYYSDRDFGTLDLGLDCKRDSGEHIIVILDYKYGKGVEVEVMHNPQIISYAMSFISYLKQNNLVTDDDIKSIQTIIYQPRIEQNQAKRHSYDLVGLNKEAERISKGVDLVYDIYSNGGKERAVSFANSSEDACRFCKAKNICKKYNEEMLSLLSDLPLSRDTLDTMRALTDEQMIKVLEFEKNVLPKINEYIKFVKSDLENRLIAGESITGVHLVQGTSRAQYISDTNKVIEILNENGIDAIDHSIKLKTITEIKKEISKISIDKSEKESILNNIICRSEAKFKVELYDDIKLVDNLVDNLVNN